METEISQITEKVRDVNGQCKKLDSGMFQRGGYFSPRKKPYNSTNFDLISKEVGKLL